MLFASFNLMLPDYPKSKAKISHRINLILKFRQNGHLLGRNKMFQHEGDRATMQDVQGNVREIQYKEFSHTFTVPKADMPQFGLQQLLEHVEETGNEMQKHMTHSLVSAIDAASKHADTGVTVSERKITAEGILEGLEKIHMEFGIDGNAPPDLVLLMSPNTVEDMKEVQKEIDARPDLQARYDQLIAKKRQEYHVRESNRRLAD